MANLVSRMMTLLGKRSDDPEVLRFHKDEGLEPPPHVFNKDLAYDVKHPSKHYAVMYSAEAKREGLYPPRRENGQYVAYLTTFELKPAFAEIFADGATTKLSHKEAKARAMESNDTGYAIFHVLQRENGAELAMMYDSDKPHELRHVRVALDELDEDDDADAAVLEKLASAAPKPAVRPLLTAAQIGGAAKEKFPAILKRLADIGEDGFGDEVDLTIETNWERGGPKAWTRNADAEQHFRVFGSDGSGGLLAFWLTEPGKPIAEQPVVFLESEGNMGVVARNLADLLVLLADGVGPYEVIEYGTSKGEANEAVRALADEMPGTKGRHAVDVIRAANVAYPDFEAWMAQLRAEDEDDEEDEDEDDDGEDNDEDEDDDDDDDDDDEEDEDSDED